MKFMSHDNRPGKIYLNETYYRQRRHSAIGNQIPMQLNYMSVKTGEDQNEPEIRSPRS